MNASLRMALTAADEAARAAGKLMRQHLNGPKRITTASQHDIKLELDVRCQDLIEKRLHKALPAAAFLGEEGVTGDPSSSLRWVVDPIDGTVNFTYGIPHACVSIALQETCEPGKKPSDEAYADGYRTLLGVVHEPFTGDTWTATATGPARLNGRIIHVSERTRLAEAIVSMGFAKQRSTLNRMLPVFERMIHRVRKIRIMGAAALAMTYVASGRFDAYVESGVRLWDIAAGGLILQRAGGVYWRREVDSEQTYAIVVSPPRLQRALHQMSSERSV